jgi:hypothetical protein
VIDNIHNYWKKEKKHMNRMNSVTTFTLSAKRTKTRQMSNKEMGGKYENVTGNLT